MPLYTFGGDPASTLVDQAGNVVPDWPVDVLVFGTENQPTLYEADGTTPISQLRSNPAGDPAPGAIRTFKTSTSQIDYRYYDAGSNEVRWFAFGRELPALALSVKTQLDNLDPDTLVRDAEVGAAGGVASLNNYGKVPASQLPPAASNAVQKSTQIFDAFDYGGSGNGTSDDTAAIQGAISAAHTIGGGRVLLRPGYTFAITTLYIKPGVHLVAHGATILRTGSDHMLDNRPDSGSASGYDGVGNFTIEGGTWDHNGANNSNPHTVFSLGHSSDVTIRDLTVRNVRQSHAFDLGGNRRMRIENVTFANYYSIDGSADISCIQIDFCRAGTFVPFGENDGTGCEDILIIGCSWPAPESGALPFGRAVGSHSGWTDHHKNIRLVANNVEAATEVAFRPFEWRDFVIADNTITGTRGGIQCLSPNGTQDYDAMDQPGVTITGNIIHDTVADTTNWPGIQMVGHNDGRYTDVNVSGNVIYNIAADHGVDLRYVVGGFAYPNSVTGIEAGYSELSTANCSDLDTGVVSGGGGGATAIVTNVLDYGAAGDGSTDDLSAINSALSAASGGTVVYFPAGTYAIAGTLSIPARVTLDGGGVATLKATSTVTGGWIDPPGSGGATVRGMILDGNEQVTGRLITPKSDCLIEACVLKNITSSGSAAVRIYDPTETTVRDCLLDNVFQAFYIGGGTDIHILGNRIINWIQRVIYVVTDSSTACHQLDIIGNRVSDLDLGNANGTVRQPISFQGAQTNPSTNVRVNDNVVIGPDRAYTASTNPGTADQISLHDVKGFQVTGNISVYGGDLGVTLSKYCYHGVVQGNVCMYNENSGINLGEVTQSPVGNLSVVGNTCVNNGQSRDGTPPSSAGIRIYHGQNVAVTGNTCGDDQSTPTQAYGLTILNSDSIHTAANILNGNATGSMNTSGNTDSSKATTEAL
ncbi:MAG: glycosyl hydrolase family 28-related protein [Nocardioidaceae bacterium]